VTLSQSYRAIGPGVALAWGLPDLDTGDLTDGVRITRSGEAAVLIEAKTTAGGWASVATITPAGVTFAEGVSIVAGTAAGLKIGTATTQTIGFYNKTRFSNPERPGRRRVSSRAPGLP
jgi:hypothetical protein